MSRMRKIAEKWLGLKKVESEEEFWARMDKIFFINADNVFSVSLDPEQKSVEVTKLYMKDAKEVKSTGFDYVPCIPAKS